MVNRGTRLIGYARVSTKQQADEGLSLRGQHDRIRAYCELAGAELVRIETDAGCSAKTLRGRPALARALRAVKDGDVDGLVVVQLDRMTRSLRDLQAIVDSLFRDSGALVSIKESFDTSTPMGRFALSLIGLLSEWQADQIAESTRDTLDTKRARGEHLGGRVPFGYRLRADGSGRLCPDDDEQAAIVTARTLRAMGMSLSAVAEDLESRGFLGRTGRRLHPAQVRLLVMDEQTLEQQRRRRRARRRRAVDVDALLSEVTHGC